MSSNPLPTTAEMSPRRRFENQYPGVFYLEPSRCEEIEDYLRNAGVLSTDEVVRATARAGDGNMNCTVRTTTNVRSLILKQSRPWVEKYPQFAAPRDRALREIEFYELVARQPVVAQRMPGLLHADRVARLLVLEDLGIGADLSGIYRGARLSPDDVDTLADYLSALHNEFLRFSASHSLPNREMRALNHAHIFEIPLQEDNGLALDRLQPGLQAAANQLRADRDYVETVRRLGTGVYLPDGDCLVHGDFFPGSLLSSADGLKVIDPEFACFGRPEVDSGMFLAHLLLGRQSPAVADRFLSRYRPPAGHDVTVMLQLAGVEVMRRIMGYAQLPLDYGLAERSALLARSRHLVTHPTLDSLLTDR